MLKKDVVTDGQTDGQTDIRTYIAAFAAENIKIYTSTTGISLTLLSSIVKIGTWFLSL